MDKIIAVLFTYALMIVFFMVCLDVIDTHKRVKDIQNKVNYISNTMYKDTNK